MSIGSTSRAVSAASEVSSAASTVALTYRCTLAQWNRFTATRHFLAASLRTFLLDFSPSVSALRFAFAGAFALGGGGSVRG